jgi:hypothetical protein
MSLDSAAKLADIGVFGRYLAHSGDNVDNDELSTQNKVVESPPFLSPKMSKRIPRPRGRPATDLAITTRNRLLAYEVKEAADCNWDALDDWILDFADHETKRPRLMWSMAKYGLQPVHRKENGFDLIARLSTDDRFTSAVANYRSAIWKLLTPPALSVEVRQTLLKQLLDERGLFQASESQQYWGAWFYPEDSAFRVRQEDSMLRVSHEMDGTHLLDKIALFACVYIDAMDQLDLTAARDCVHAMQYLTVFYGDQIPSMTDDLNVAFRGLLTARVLKGDWTSDISHFRNHSDRLLSRQRLITADNSCTETNALRPFPLVPPEAPLVFHSERTRWVQKHSEELQREIPEEARPPWMQVVIGQPIESEDLVKSRAYVKRKFEPPL